MLLRADIKNFTLFSAASLEFSPNLNVFVGENSTGKTHLLKLIYSVLAVASEGGKKPSQPTPTKTLYQVQLAEKLINVFRPETLGRLARRKQGRERCDIALQFNDQDLDIAFSFATQSKSEVAIETLPKSWGDVAPAFFPTRELLTIYPNFLPVYEGHYLEFEETWRDTCALLGALLQKGPKEKRIRQLLQPLEEAMGGSIVLDRNGRFYLRTSEGRMEMPLVAEGLRKLGMLSRLIATGVLLDKGYLFWDEPEANLNPRIVKKVVASILELSRSGIQVFIATHSLFFLRELEILSSGSQYKDVNTRFFGLQRNTDGVSVLQGDSIDDIGDISALDEELEQSERFLDLGAS